jgi:hypothetical protein
MSHDNHVIDGINADLKGMSPTKAQKYYLDLAADWSDPYPEPVVETYDGVRVVRDDLLVGSKVRGGDCLISKLKPEQDTIVYVQPRFGLAGVSILDVAKRHNKKVVLFMPSSKRVSYHQACCIERGAEPLFIRIAAMPNANRVAKEWAEARENCFFVPLGLRHELVTAGFVKTMMQMKEPDEVWSVCSTGVLTRAMQVSWPNAEFHAVAVARNMKAGELGRAEVISAPEAFTQAVRGKDVPPFPTVACYDAKAWRYIPKNSGRDILFWNVGDDPLLLDPTIFDRVDSYREWGDDRDYRCELNAMLVSELC